jgi:tetratricopeptide (TPR) repeat protein
MKKLHGLLLLLVVGPLWAQSEALLAQADELYARRTEMAADVQALALYQQIPTKSAEVYWKAARAAWWAGTRSVPPSSGGHFFEEGMDLARIAVKLDAHSTEAHFWLGSNILSYGNTRGAFTSLRLIKQVRVEMAFVLAHNPAYLGAGADRILGILDYKIPSLVGGNRRRALEHLQKSLEINADNPVTTFYLADYYADGGDKEKARAELLKMESLHPSEDFSPEYKLMLPEATALAKKLGVTLNLPVL